MTEGRLGNMGVMALHGFEFELKTETICENFIKKHHRKMCKSIFLNSKDFTIVILLLMGVVWVKGGWLATPSTSAPVAAI